ncbi:hypothetical protein BJY00DRAFT_309944 [Aspergillus carlsbadensis]|nr:hypothetical protein BJY00DRAFT_309944 [Aspergillus carlsbadensis]
MEDIFMSRAAQYPSNKTTPATTTQAPAPTYGGNPQNAESTVEWVTTGPTTTTIIGPGYNITETLTATTDDPGTIETGTIQTVTGFVFTPSFMSSTEPRPPSGITTVTVFSPSPTSTSASSGSDNDRGGGGGGGNSGLSTGAIAAVGIGVGLGVVFLAVGVILLFQRRRRKREDGESMPELGEERPPVEMG